MNQNELDDLARRLADMIACKRYQSEHGKQAFHRLGRRVLKALAETVGCPRYRIRSNKGGPAVTGEVILHADTFYLVINPSFVEPVLYRQCSSMDDYTGGQNRWATVANMSNPGFVQMLQRWVYARDLSSLAA